MIILTAFYVKYYFKSRFNASSTISFWRATSLSCGNWGSPVGYGIACAPDILAAPTVSEIGVTVHICAAGIPAFSICFTIVAPQRVHVPQVEVNITPSTPAESKSSAISCPILVASATDVEFPVVVSR